MKRSLIRKVATIGAAAVAIGAAAVVAPATAQAAVVGNVSFTPATGNALSTQSISSSGGCVEAGAVGVRALAFGFGFPAAGQVIFGQSTLAFSTTDPMILSVADTWKAFAQENSTYLDGDYDVRIQCVDDFGAVVFDEYTTTISWQTPGNSPANINGATYTTPLNNVTTTTTLGVTPSGPVDEGTEIDLTATVAPAAATGSVAFFDGATQIGTGTLAAGVATLNDVVLADGAHSLTAVYAGNVVGNTNYATSTSTAVPFQVDNVVINTTTTLSATGSGAQYSPVVLDATVVPNNAVGSIEFRDGATVVGTRPVAGGTASLTIPSPALGAHSYTAHFVPTNAQDFGASDSAASAYTVAASAGEIQNITAEIPAGALTLSVEDDGAVLLNASLAADGSAYNASGAMDPVTVVDTRAGAFGWTANGQLGDFYQGGNASIAAENLGWAPTVTGTSNALLTVTAGPTVPAADAVAPNSTSNEGLAAQRVLAAAPAGASVGTAELDAVLTLKAPTTTSVGTHTAVLTLTAI